MESKLQAEKQARRPNIAASAAMAHGAALTSLAISVPPRWPSWLHRLTRRCGGGACAKKHTSAARRARAARRGGAARMRVVAARRHVAGAGQGAAVSAAVRRPPLSCPPPSGAAAERGFPRHHERCRRAGVRPVPA